MERLGQSAISRYSRESNSHDWIAEISERWVLSTTLTLLPTKDSESSPSSDSRRELPAINTCVPTLLRFSSPDKVLRFRLFSTFNTAPRWVILFMPFKERKVSFPKMLISSTCVKLPRPAKLGNDASSCKKSSYVSLRFASPRRSVSAPFLAM